MIITSDRKFGVEIEFFCQTQRQLRNIANCATVVSDGSLRGVAHSGEYVSPVLQGEDGERSVYSTCELLKKNSASGDNPAMSVHVHLDGRRRSQEPIITDRRPDDVTNTLSAIAISKRLLKAISPAMIKSVSCGTYVLTYVTINGSEHSVYATSFRGVIYYSLAELKREPLMNYSFYTVYRPDRVKWLKNVLYFYTQYSDVMENIVSNSRKFGNMYCIPLASSYDLGDIEKCNTEEELMGVWYKGGLPSGHYDDSRYHNVNLHSYWDRHGTVEIRSHGGTVDPNKILLWVKLHQKIVDKLEDMTIDDIKLKGGTDIYRSFLEFVEEPLLKNYVKRLLGFYSNIIIK
jgi:hypothetical protein